MKVTWLVVINLRISLFLFVFFLVVSSNHGITSAIIGSNIATNPLHLDLDSKRKGEKVKMVFIFLSLG